MSSDPLDYAPRTARSPWRRRLIAGAFFALGAGIAAALTAACAYVLDPNLLPHRS